MCWKVPCQMENAIPAQETWIGKGHRQKLVCDSATTLAWLRSVSLLFMETSVSPRLHREIERDGLSLCLDLSTLDNFATYLLYTYHFYNEKYIFIDLNSFALSLVRALRTDLPFLFQGIFPPQGWNLRLQHCRQSPVLQMDSLPPEPPGKPSTD